MRLLIFGLRLLFLPIFLMNDFQEKVRRKRRDRNFRRRCAEADYSKDGFNKQGWFDVNFSDDDWKAQLDEAIEKSKERQGWLSRK